MIIEPPLPCLLFRGVQEPPTIASVPLGWMHPDEVRLTHASPRGTRQPCTTLLLRVADEDGQRPVIPGTVWRMLSCVIWSATKARSSGVG
jgi:hypothetical protein